MIETFDGISVSASSVTGLRNENQDSYGWYISGSSGTHGSSEVRLRDSSESLVFGVVCDGMGGLRDGAAASRTVVDGLLAWIQEMECTDVQSVIDGLLAKMSELEKNLMKSYPGSGTTVVAVLGMDDRWFSMHLGDSRCYAGRNGSFTRTWDHAPVDAMLKAGLITEEETFTHPMRHAISKYMGGGNSGDIEVHELGDWDTLVLCSDGAHSYIWDDVLIDLINEFNDSEDIVRQCLEKGSRDNITVLKFVRVS